MEPVRLLDIREKIIQQAMSLEGLPDRDSHIMLVSMQLWTLLKTLYRGKEKEEFYGYRFFEVRSFIRENESDAEIGLAIQKLIEQVEREHFCLVKAKYKLIWGLPL